MDYLERCTLYKIDIKMKFIIISLVFFTTLACGQNQNNKQSNKYDMNLIENVEIKKTFESIKIGMIEFIELGEQVYTISDVEECMSLIDSFLTNISNSEAKEDGMLNVKRLVLELNDLNEKCEYELIETNQREQIADLIILAGHLKGFNERNEDITEEWREWQ